MLAGKRIIVGVTGSIAAYKAAILVRLLVKAGAEVRVGDIISVRYGERLTQYAVVTLSEHVLKQDAAGMYRVIPG